MPGLPRTDTKRSARLQTLWLQADTYRIARQAFMSEFAIIYVFLVGLITWWAVTLNRHPILWAGIALILSPLIAGIALLVLGEEDEAVPGSGNVRCPMCAELIRAEAIKCKHCGADLRRVRNAEHLNEEQLNRLIAELQGRKDKQ
jgi:hypothetical protein